jgi:hypothetical protein
VFKALGNPNLLTEQTYLKGNIRAWGDAGSVRLDVVEITDGNPLMPIKVWDLKTGIATLKQARIFQIRLHLPKLYDTIPIYVLTPK